jgi:hypothetical protein
MARKQIDFTKSEEDVLNNLPEGYGVMLSVGYLKSVDTVSTDWELQVMKPIPSNAYTPLDKNIGLVAKASYYDAKSGEKQVWYYVVTSRYGYPTSKWKRYKDFREALMLLITKERMKV